MAFAVNEIAPLAVLLLGSRVAFGLCQSDERTLATAGSQDWQTVYDRKLFLALDTEGKSIKGAISRGQMILGRPGTLPLPGANHDFDDIGNQAVHGQDTASDHGVIIRMDMPTGQSSIASPGHGRPQVLPIYRDTGILEPSHDPRRVDEIDLGVQGDNYGLPEVDIRISPVLSPRRPIPLSSRSDRGRTPTTHTHSGTTLSTYTWRKL